jgi:ferrous iron transport protein A
MFPLGLLASGERGEVVESVAVEAVFGPGAAGHAHKAGCGGCGCAGRSGARGRVEDMGLRPGRVVEMLTNEGRGALLVKVDESRIAVSRSVAMKILVRRRGDEPGEA